MKTPLVIAGERLLCRAHIGISVFPNDTKIAEDLLHNAVLALVGKFQINEKGSHFFLPPMRTKMDRRLSVKYDLEKAIEAEDFTLYYQPKQLLETGRISGVEALVRWNHSDHGEISPVEFIPIAERSRLILPLGAWILRKACEQTKKLNDQGLGPLKVAVSFPHCNSMMNTSLKGSGHIRRNGNVTRVFRIRNHRIYNYEQCDKCQ